MQQAFQASRVDESLHLAELRQSIAQRLMIAIPVIVCVTHIWITAIWLDSMDWRSWYLSLGLVVLTAVAWLWSSRQPEQARSVWVLGLACLVPGGALFLHQPLILVFFVLLPMITVILGGWRQGLVVWAGGVCTIWVLMWYVHIAPLLAVVVILAGLVSGLIGWIVTGSLFLAIDWALRSFAEAERNMNDARDHRARLMTLYKNLDQAYYRLERANAALVAAWKTIEEAERFKAEFVAHVSHEMRTPLNLIIGFSEMMIAAPESYGGMSLPGRYRSDLNIIARNAQHLLALVDDVLDLSRIEAGKIALIREPVDFAELADGVSDLLREYIIAKGLALHVQVPHDLPRLWIDRLRIRQVLLNLLTNAARHTGEGHLEISACAAGDEVMVRVVDTGMGIPKHELARIFAQFQTSVGLRSKWPGGAGLGLPISRKFVELHGGRMGVESHVGAGSCFWFTLPTYHAQQEDTPTIARPRWRPSVRLGETDRLVVVVHNDMRVAKLVDRQLAGYRVLHATDEEAGVRLAAEHQALALLTPTPLTRLDGVPPDLMVLHCPLPNSRVAATSIGANELLVKPIVREELLDALNRLPNQPRRVLIVDDEPDMVQLCRKMLFGRFPAQALIGAHGGEEALDVLQREPIDLLILDLAMPHPDGRAVLSTMAQVPRLAGIPVILISGTGQDEIAVDHTGPIVLNRGRPFRLGEVMRAMDALLSALAPGWQELNANAPASRAGQAEKPVW